MRAEFLDTTVLLHLLDSGIKADRARQLLSSGPSINVQVLNEAANAGTRKLRMTWAEIGVFLDGVQSRATVHPLTEATHRAGRRLAERYRFATYDAMIVAAALDAGCGTLWSEDMHDGLLVEERLTIRNPFRLAEGVPA